MKRNGLNMKEIDEILRLTKLGLTNRQIARATGIHRNTVNKYVERLSETTSTESATVATLIEPAWTQDVDWEKIRSEFLSGVSLKVLHEELVESKHLSVQYPGFWKQVQKRLSLTEATMVRIFKPGDRIEIDYADGLEIMNPTTGELKRTQLFVGVLCNSRYAFAEFTESQKSADFLQSHVNMFEYFGGTTQVVSPDNLKSAVTKAHRYDPVINQAYTRLASHYDIGVVPARVRTPQDKAIVERTIQIFQRYFFMKVRNRTFTSLVDLNKALREHLVEFNNKKHRIFKKTRLEMYLNEKSFLKALPEASYKVATYHRAKLNRDCHLTFETNYYSAPHNLRGQELDIWSTAKTVEIFSNGERVALHARAKSHGLYHTDTNHYPATHAAYAEEDVQKLIAKAQVIGPETSVLVESLLTSVHPLRYLTRVRGILALAHKYNSQLLESACKSANQFNQLHTRYIERVIKTRKGVNRELEDQEVRERASNPHLRGIESYH